MSVPYSTSNTAEADEKLQKYSYLANGVSYKGKVTKRVIKFTGFNSETESILNALEASLLSKLKTELSKKQVENPPSHSAIDID